MRQGTREENCIVHIHYLAKGGGSWGITLQTVICFPFWMELENPKTSKEKNFMRAQQQLNFAILLVSHRSMQGCNDLRERQMNMGTVAPDAWCTDPPFSCLPNHQTYKHTMPLLFLQG